MNTKVYQQLATEYLASQGFYSYRDNLDKTSANLQKEIAAALSKSNRRRLSLPRRWSEIRSFGPTRPLLIIELGGTFLKIFKVKVSSREVKLIKEVKIDFYEDIIYTPQVLFNRLLSHLNNFLSTGERLSLPKIFFIFTFSQDQSQRFSGQLEGRINNFGKSHRGRGIVGLKIGQSLEKFLRKHGYPKVKISVTNDTPATLLAFKKHEFNQQKIKSQAILNLIVGTGTNLGIGFNQKDQFSIYNTEFGNFRSIPISKLDTLLQRKLSSGNSYQTEKMFSGNWQWQLFNTILQDLKKKKLVSTEFLTTHKLEKMDSTALEIFFRKSKLTDMDFYFLQKIWREQLERGAFICALVLANFIKYLYLKQLISSSHQKAIQIAILPTGSVIDYAYNFQKSLHKNTATLLAKLCPPNLEIGFHPSENPTIYGAALLDQYF
ncbi:MAG: hexokinase family protein [Candidatus Altimarinota bacterium]